MKKTTFFLALAMTVVSCDNKTEQLQEQINALQSELTERNQQYSQLSEFISVISDGLDSISIQENGIRQMSPESPISSKEQMKTRLSELKNTVSEQRNRLAQLENDLASNKGDNKKLRNLIATYKKQLEDKEAQVADLLKQLTESKLTVKELQGHVDRLVTLVSDQEETIDAQSEALASKDKMLNTGFIKIGNKKELKESGLLQGGFLKKKKVDYSKIDLNQFQSIDIRTVTEIPIPAKKAKLLTPVPEDSYEIQEKGTKCSIIIRDKTKFWSVSNFLIIEI